MYKTYRAILGDRRVRRLATIGLLVKTATPVLSVALLLVVVDRLESYAVAGLVLSGHGLAVAFGAPVGGRLADRLGVRRVLIGYLLMHGVAYAALLATILRADSAGQTVAAAVALGATTPPAGAIIRACWPRLVRRELLRTAYALDTAINELMFIAGPAMVFLLMLITSPLVIVAAAGLAVLTGTAWLLSGAEPSVRFEKAKTGPLRDRATVLLLTIAALGAASFGCLRIAITAATTTLGAPAAAGAMFSLLSLGALAGGLAFGARHWTHPAWRILVLLCLADALMLLLAGWAPGLIALALLITLSGLLAGPRDTLLQVMLAQGARSAQRTEVFAWLNTFMWAGYALGTTTAGYLTEDSGAVPFTTAAMTALIGAALVVPLRRAEGTATPALRTTASDVVDR